MKKKTLYIAIIVFVLALLGTLTYVHQPSGTWICDFSKDDVSIHPRVDSVFNLFDGLPSENVSVYLVISPSDQDELPQQLQRSTVLCASREDVVKGFAEAAVFKRTVGDMATAESMLYIVNNNKVIYKTPIVVSSTCIGIQNSQLGWCEAVDPESLVNELTQFDTSCYPRFFF